MGKKFQALLSLESIPKSTHFVGRLSVGEDEFAVQCHERDSGLKVLMAKVNGDRQDEQAREGFIQSRLSRSVPKITTQEMLAQLPGRLSKMHPALKGVSITVVKQKA